MKLEVWGRKYGLVFKPGKTETEVIIFSKAHRIERKAPNKLIIGTRRIHILNKKVSNNFRPLTKSVSQLQTIVPNNFRPSKTVYYFLKCHYFTGFGPNVVF